MKMLLIPHDVALCGACRPWIFFITGVLCFLRINGSIMEKEERLLDTQLQREDESRMSSLPQEAMDKSLKVGEDE